MSKRQFNDDERALSEKSIKADEVTLDLLEKQKKVVDNELEMLPIKFELMTHVKKEEAKKNDFQIEFLKEKMKTLQDQLKNGVEVQEEKK